MCRIVHFEQYDEILFLTKHLFIRSHIKCLLLNTSTLWSNHFYVFVPRIRFCYSIVCGLMTYPHFQTYFRSEDQFDLWPSINKSLLIFAFYIRKEEIEEILLLNFRLSLHEHTYNFSHTFKSCTTVFQIQVKPCRQSSDSWSE